VRLLLTCHTWVGPPETVSWYVLLAGLILDGSAKRVGSVKRRYSVNLEYTENTLQGPEGSYTTLMQNHYRNIYTFALAVHVPVKWIRIYTITMHLFLLSVIIKCVQHTSVYGYTKRKSLFFCT